MTLPSPAWLLSFAVGAVGVALPPAPAAPPALLAPPVTLGVGPLLITAGDTVPLFQGPAEVSQSSLLRWSPDGKVFTVVDGAKTVEIRDGASGALRGVAEGSLAGIEWSPDGRRLAIVTPGGVALWETASGRARFVATPPGAVVNPSRCLTRAPCARFSPDGSRLLVPERDRLTLWDLQAGRLITQVRAPGLQDGDDFGWAGTSALFAARLPDQGVALFDGRSGAPRPALSPPGSDAAPGPLAFARSGATLAVGGEDGRVRLFDAERGTLLSTAAPLAGKVTALAWHPGGKALAVGLSEAREDSAWLWDLAAPPQPVSGIEERTRAWVRWDITGLQWDPTGERLAVLRTPSGMDLECVVVERKSRGIVSACEMAVMGSLGPDLKSALGMKGTESPLTLLTLGGPAQPRFALKQAGGSYPGWALDQGGHRALVENTLFDLSTGAATRFPEKTRFTVAEPALPDLKPARLLSAPSPDGAWIVASEKMDQRLYYQPCLYEVRARRCAVPLATSPVDPSFAKWSFSPDGRWLAAFGSIQDDLITLFDTRSGRVAATVPLGRHADCGWASAQVLVVLGGAAREELRLFRMTDRATLQVRFVNPSDTRDRAAALQPLFLRDDGTFDGDEALWKHALVRVGADVASAPLRPLADVAARLRRKDLYQSFLAGR